MISIMQLPEPNRRLPGIPGLSVFIETIKGLKLSNLSRGEKIGLVMDSMLWVVVLGIRIIDAWAGTEFITNQQIWALFKCHIL